MWPVRLPCVVCACTRDAAETQTIAIIEGNRKLRGYQGWESCADSPAVCAVRYKEAGMNKLSVVLILLAGAALAQDRERRLWNTEFREARAATPAAPAPAARSAAPKPATADRGLMLGLTTWRLRESKAGDRARLLVHEPNTGPVIELT